MKKIKSMRDLRKLADRSKAKKKAQERNAGGAIIRDLDKPQGPYTKEIICVDCGKPRLVKPQDAFQVKRCKDCQEKKKGAKLKSLIERKSSPTAAREERVKKGLAKLDAYVKQNDEDCANFVRFRKRLDEEHAKQPKAKRIWPK